ncbi:MAG: response regulator transcription factor [Cyclobacteriaceae bacterium]|nr:response regulator transcription factor [Cyclobacteriaceae bacterium]UYN86016.1 MAG: response regulator transcription factor [Cyclobacteriaceae bacterium]
MNILIVEDEPNLLALMRKGFAEHNYEVSVAMDGNTALDMLSRYQFDVVIMDIMLPDVNGLEICRRVRVSKNFVPVLLLTALGSNENIVTGLDSGADDYLVKPFKFSELEARVRALSRRANYSDRDANTLQVADLLVDRVAKTVSRAGKDIKLTAMEFKLLEYMVRNKGIVLSRNQLLENVWDIRFDMSTNVVDVYINYLRKKIDKPFGEKMIHTMKGLGYVIRSERGAEE